MNEIILDCPDLIISAPAFRHSGLESIEVNIKEISEGSFADCASLENVKLHEGVHTIQANAFENCSGLNSIILPSTLKLIGQGACIETGISSLEVPRYVEIIGNLPNRKGVTVFSGLPPLPATDPLTEVDILIVDSDATINGWYNTEAHNYAISNELKFNPLDDIMYGDTNSDGTVNIADAVLLQKYLLNSGDVGYEAYTQIGVSIASLLYYTGPVIVMILSPILFKEKITVVKIIGFTAVLVGIFLINGNLSDGQGNLFGVLCGLLSAVMYSVMVMANKKSEHIKGLENSVIQLIVSFLTVYFLWRSKVDLLYILTLLIGRGF